jgi:FkbM family methyltransferase
MYTGYCGLNKSIPRELRAQFDTLNFVLQINRQVAICSSDLAIDVGAHHGSSTRAFLDAGLRVLAFEPDHKNRQKLAEKFVQDRGVLIDKRALGLYPDEECDFYTSELSHGISSKLPFHESHKRTGIVQSTNLSKVYKDYEIDHVGILKIDAEGVDYSILQGLPWEIDTPDIIICEFEDKKTKILGITHSDICEFLYQKGYCVLISEWHPIQKYGIQHDWRGLKLFPSCLHDQNAWGDILAFKAKLDPQSIEKISWENVEFKSE